MKFPLGKSGQFFIVATIFSLNITLGNASNSFQDTSLTVDVRVNDLISRMTLAEKLSQLGNQAPAIARLSIPAYNYWNEALHGVGRSGLATSFPQAIALSSTWDPDLIFQIGSAISDEARVKNNTEGKGLTYWSPTINMARDPRWGRSEENYGEDCFLTGRIAVNFIRGMQGNDPKYLKTVATAKHFACNNVEVNRYGISSTVDERSLREYYLPAFKACVTEGKVFSIMSAYNALNGVPCPANRTLLTNILRKEWGFNGYVVSDCDAVSNVWDAHHYVSSATEATAISIRNGSDLNCGTTYPANANKAISNGLMSEEDVNVVLRRVYKARFLLGEFDPPSMVPYTSIPGSKLDCQANRKLALQAAREAIVLLKNQNSILPLHKDSVHSIAVIGPNADLVQLGGYSGSPSVSISPLRGIQMKMGILPSADGKIEAENYSDQKGVQTEACSEGGNNVGFIENGDFTVYDSVAFGTNQTTMDIRVASNTSGGTLNMVLDSIDGPLIANFTIQGTGGWQNWKTLSTAISPVSGKHTVYLKFMGGTGYLFNLNWFRIYNPQDTTSTSSLAVQYSYGCSIKGAINQTDLNAAVALAKKSDVAIVVCGTDLSVADEGNDRTTLNLPGSQEQLIKAVYHANPKTILVLVTGFSLAVNWEQDSIPAILSAWYDGQAQGNAIADVLFGDYNPGGKLSTTWYKSITDLPSMNDYDIKDNRTYMYFNGTPLYPFGYGLSYTSFVYSNLKISSQTLINGDSILISADITNSGAVTGDEVVQLYVHAQSSSVVRPIKELKAFQRVTLQPGETRAVNLKLKHNALSYYDEQSKTFIVEDGKVDILVGSSSGDIRLNGQISVTGGTVFDTYRQDPFEIIEAENFENNSSTSTITSCKEGGLCVDFTKNNSYIVFKNVDFSTEAKQLDARLATTAQSGATIQILLDSLDGQLAGTLQITPTVDLNTFATQSCELKGVSGVRDVYLVFKSAASGNCSLNWFRFQKTFVMGIKQMQEDEYKLSVFPNPAFSELTVNYTLPEKSNVKIDIYNPQGILINSFSKKNQINGFHQWIIDVRSLNPGLYFIKFSGENYSKIQAINVIK